MDNSKKQWYSVKEFMACDGWRTDGFSKEPFEAFAKQYNIEKCCWGKNGASSVRIGSAYYDAVKFWSVAVDSLSFADHAYSFKTGNGQVYWTFSPYGDVEEIKLRLAKLKVPCDVLSPFYADMLIVLRPEALKMWVKYKCYQKLNECFLNGFNEAQLSSLEGTLCKEALVL